jgi:hypothetical protein
MTSRTRLIQDHSFRIKIYATNFNSINRFSGYAQWSLKSNMQVKYGIMQNSCAQLGVIGASTATKSQITVSPRVQFAIKPDWERKWF